VVLLTPSKTTRADAVGSAPMAQVHKMSRRGQKVESLANIIEERSRLRHYVLPTSAKQLEAIRAKLATLEAEVAAVSHRELAALPERYGFDSVRAFVVGGTGPRREKTPAGASRARRAAAMKARKRPSGQKSPTKRGAETQETGQSRERRAQRWRKALKIFPPERAEHQGKRWGLVEKEEVNGATRGGHLAVQ